MNRQRKILIIEDEQPIARIVKDYLTINGYEAIVTHTGKDGLQAVESEHPDFIILDIMLPDADGIELCRQIRENHLIPILLLSARGSDTDKVLGLGFGADDYMTKPFSLSELVARIHAHLRRSDRMASAAPPAPASVPQEEGRLRFGTLTIDKKAYQVTVEGKEVSLSAKEFELLYFLAKHPNQVFTKSQLLDAIWGFNEYGDENTITVYVRRIREKIEADPSSPIYVRTVWGVGYKFSED